MGSRATPGRIGVSSAWSSRGIPPTSEEGAPLTDSARVTESRMAHDGRVARSSRAARAARVARSRRPFPSANIIIAAPVPRPDATPPQRAATWSAHALIARSSSPDRVASGSAAASPGAAITTAMGLRSWSAPKGAAPARHS